MPFFGGGKKSGSGSKEDKEKAGPQPTYSPPAAPVAQPPSAAAAGDSGADLFGGMTVTRTRRRPQKKDDDAVSVASVETAAVHRSATAAAPPSTAAETAPAVASQPPTEPTGAKQSDEPFLAPKLNFLATDHANFDFQVEDPEAARLRRRLERFYEKYNPQKLANIDATMTAFQGREAALFEALITKYGPEPDGDLGAVGNTEHSDANSAAREPDETASGWGSTGWGEGGAAADSGGFGVAFSTASAPASGDGFQAAGFGGFPTATTSEGGGFETAGFAGAEGWGTGGDGGWAGSTGFGFSTEPAPTNGFETASAFEAPKTEHAKGEGFGAATNGFGADPHDAPYSASNAQPPAESSSDDEDDVPLYERQQRELRSAVSYLADARAAAASTIAELAETIESKRREMRRKKEMEAAMEVAIAAEDFDLAEQLDEQLKQLQGSILTLEARCRELPQQLESHQQEVEAALKDLASLSEQHGVSLKANIGEEERRVDRFITEKTHKLSQVGDRVAAELERSTRNMNNIEQEVVNLQQRKKKIEDRISSETAGLRKERDQLQTAKRTVEEEIRELEATLANKRRALAEWKLALGDVEEKLGIILGEHEATKAEVELQMTEETGKLNRARTAVDALSLEEEKNRREKAELEEESSRLRRQMEVQKARMATSAETAARIRSEGIEHARTFFSGAVAAVMLKRAEGEAVLCPELTHEAGSASSFLPALANLNQKLAEVERQLQAESTQHSALMARLQEVSKTLPLLEAAKKAAAAAKQFREASQKTAEIKQLTDEKAAAEKAVSEGEQRTEALRSQLETLRSHRKIEEENASKVISSYIQQYKDVLIGAATVAELGSGIPTWMALLADDDQAAPDSASDPLVLSAIRLIRALRQEATDVAVRDAKAEVASSVEVAPPNSQSEPEEPPAPACEAQPEATPARTRAELVEEIAALERDVELAAESEDYEHADALQRRVDQLKQELPAE